MSKKLTVIVFPRSEGEVNLARQSYVLDLITASAEAEGQGIVTGPNLDQQPPRRLVSSGNARMEEGRMEDNGSKNAPQIREDSFEPKDPTKDPIASFNKDSLVIEFLCYDTSDELTSKSLLFQLEDEGILGSKQFIVPFSKFTNQESTSYVKAAGGQWDALLNLARGTLLVRLWAKDSRPTAEKTENSLKKDLSSMYSNLDNFTAVMKPILMKAYQYLSFKDDDNSSGEEELLITEEEIEKLKISPPTTAASPLVSSESDSEDERTITNEYRKKFRDGMKSVLPLDSKRPFNINSPDFITYCEKYKESLLNMIKYSQKLDEALFWLYLGGIEFIQLPLVQPSYKSYFGSSSTVKLTEDEKVELWTTKILKLEELTNRRQPRERHRERDLIDDFHPRHRQMEDDFDHPHESFNLRDENIVMYITSSQVPSSSIKPTALYFLMERDVNHSLILQLFGVYQKEIVRENPYMFGGMRGELRGDYTFKREKEVVIQLPILEFVLNNLDISDASGFFEGDKDELTEGFTTLFTLVKELKIKDLEKNLMNKLLQSSFHEYSHMGHRNDYEMMMEYNYREPKRNHRGGKKKKSSTDLVYRILKFCLMEKNRRNAFGNAVLTHASRSIDAVQSYSRSFFDCICKAATEDSSVSGNFKAAFSTYLIKGLKGSPYDKEVSLYKGVLDHLSTEFLYEQSDKKQLAAFIFSSEDLSKDYKRDCLKLLINRIGHNEATYLLKRLANQDPEFACPKKDLHIEAIELVLTAEQCYKGSTEFWTKVFIENRNKPIDAIVQFIQIAQEKREYEEHKKDTVFCNLLAETCMENPEFIKVLEVYSNKCTLVRLFFFVKEFIEKDTSLESITISTIQKLYEHQDKLIILELYEKTSGPILSKRIEEEKKREAELANYKQNIHTNVKNIQDSDTRIKELTFLAEADTALHALDEKYLKSTVNQVLSSKEYTSLKPIIDPSFDFFIRLKKRDPFIRELVLRKSDTCAEFINNVRLAKDELKQMLTECEAKSEKMTISVVEQIFPKIVTKDERAENYEEMLTSLEIGQKTLDSILTKSRHLIAAKKMIQVIELSKKEGTSTTCLERLIQLQPFSNAPEDKYRVIKGFLEFKRAYETLNPVSYNELTYQFLLANDSQKLREIEIVQRLDCDFVDDFSQLFNVIEFLAQDKAEKKLLDKLNQDLDNTKWDLRDKLEESYTKLDFLLERASNPEKLLMECLSLCTLSLNALETTNGEMNSLIKYMRINLARFKSELTKTTGEFKDLIKLMMEDCIFMLELDPERHTFELTAKLLNKNNYINPAEAARGDLTKFKEDDNEFRGDFYKVDYFNSEELKDHLTKAIILIEDNKKREKREMDKPEEGDSAITNVKKVVTISRAMESIQKSMVDLFETGLINRNFQSKLIENLTESKRYKGFIRVIDSKTKLIFHIKNGNCERISSVEKCLHAKAKMSMENYIDQIKNQNNHIMTYFTQEKMDMLINWLKARPEERFIIAYTGIIGILKESLNKNEEDLKSAIQNLEFNIKKLEQSVYKLDKDGYDEDEGDQEETAEPTFEEVVKCLEMISKKVTDNTPNSGRDKLGLGSKVCIIDVNQGKDVNQYEFLLSLYMKQSISQLCLSQILYCTDTVSTVDILAFLNRCYRDQLHRVYTMINPAGLTQTVLNSMVEFIENYSEEKNINKKLIIFNNLDVSDSIKNQEFFQPIEKETVDSFSREDKEAFLNTYFSKLHSIKIVSSELPGNGKTTWILKEHQANCEKTEAYHLLELGLVGEVNKRYFEQLIAGLEKGMKQSLAEEESTGGSKTRQVRKFDIHIKIDYIDRFHENKHMIDSLLFSICFMRKCELKGKTIDLSEHINQIYIEVGNSIKNLVIDQRQLQILSLLITMKDKVPGIVQEIRGFEREGIQYDPKSDPAKDRMKRAAYYLSLFEDNKRNPGTSILAACGRIKDLGEAEYKRLLHFNFTKLNQKTSETYYNFQFWVKVYVCQVSRSLEWLIRIGQPKTSDAMDSKEKTKDSKVIDEGWIARNVGSEELGRELFLESFYAAFSIVKLHSTTASEKQVLAKDVIDLNSKRDLLEKSNKAREEIEEIDRAILQKELQLKQKIKESEYEESRHAFKGDQKPRESIKFWYTDDLFFSLVLGDNFLPVVGSPDYFNAKALANADTDSQMTKDKKDSSQRFCGISLSSKRYWAYIKEHFTRNISDYGQDSAKDDHRWFSYCLAQIRLSSRQQAGAGPLTQKEVLDNFKQILHKASEFENKKGFILTKLTYMKLCLMILKAELKTPIIIMGESGCGKTYLSKFLVEQLCEDRLKFISLYSGYDEQELIYQILEANADALRLKNENKRLWVFFDEFNTTTLQGLIADIMIDRTVPSSYFKQQKYMRKNTKHSTETDDTPLYDSVKGESLKLPDNICFIACCNPFLIKLKKNAEDDIGLVPNEKTSRLSHIVHPVPDRILALVWDFGQLPEEEEKSHILNMVKAEKLFSSLQRGLEIGQINKLNERMAGLIHRCHNAVRRIEERSGVSLRDIKRVFMFFKWFRDQMPKLSAYFKANCGRHHKNARIRLGKSWIFESQENQETASAICSIIICYCLKLNGQKKHQKELFDIIHKWANLAIGMRSLQRAEALSCLNTIAEVYLHEIEKRELSKDITEQYIDKKIAINNPFKENFMTILACYAVKCPLIIVGAPGTSKTLCSSILINVLKPEVKNHLTLFSDLDSCNFQIYCGSEVTTPAIVTRLFQKAEGIFDIFKKKKDEHDKQVEQNLKVPKFQRKPPTAKIDIPGIFFDELGLAEISPYNPLKVMHSKLEEFLGFIPFISISNWRPDQSKINRMICLSRPDLTKDDLNDIFNSTLNEKELEGPCEAFFKSAIEKLSQCYLNYREWQKCTSPNNMYHRNFHGSRDIYASIKCIIQDLGTFIESNRKLLNSIQERSRNNQVFEGEDLKTLHQTNYKILRVIKVAIERNLNGEIYKFGQTENDLKYQPDIISVINLLKAKNIELVSRPLFELLEKYGILSVKSVETLDEFLELNFMKKKEGLEAESTLFSLTSSEVFNLFYLNLLYPSPSEATTSHFRFFRNEDSIKEKKALNDFLNDTDLMRLIDMNINTSAERGIDCRFIAFRTEGSIVDDILIERLRKSRDENSDKRNVKGLIDLRSSNTTGKVEDILSQLKTYITEGNLVVMKNLDHIYAGLYELFNQKYDKTSKRCNLYYGQSPQPVIVHPDFKCVVILPTGSNIRRNNQIEKIQPAPFLNRFEKYYVPLSKLLNKEWIQLVNERISEAKQIVKDSASFFLGFNIDTLVTMVVDDEVVKGKKEPDSKGTPKRNELDARVETRFNRLLTTNYVIGQANLAVKKTDHFKKSHKDKIFRSLLDLSFWNNKTTELNTNSKAFVFTFTGSKRLKDIIDKTFEAMMPSSKRENSLEEQKRLRALKHSWTIIAAADIAKEGEFKSQDTFGELLKKIVSNRNVSSRLVPELRPEEMTLELKRSQSRKVKSVQNPPDTEAEQGKLNLIVSFELPSDYDIIRQLKSFVDQSLASQFNIGSVLFVFHLTRSSRGRRFLEKSLGISYWKGWDLMTIDSLEHTFNYDIIFTVQKNSVKDIVLEFEDDEDEENNQIENGEVEMTEEKDDEESEGKGQVEKAQPQDSLNNLGERVLRRVLGTIIEGIVYRSRILVSAFGDLKKNSSGTNHLGIPKEFNFKIIRDWLEQKDTDLSDQDYSKRFISLVAGLIKQKVKNLDSSLETNFKLSTKSDSYIDLELQLGQVFYSAYQKEVTQVMQAINVELMNLSSFVKGIKFCSQYSRQIKGADGIIEDYFKIMERISQAISVKIMKGLLDRPERPRSGPKVYYLPFRDLFKTIEEDFNREYNKFDPQRIVQNDLKFNSLKLYKYLVSLKNERNTSATLVAGTTIDKEATITKIKEDEFWIAASIKKIYTERIKPMIEKHGIDLNQEHEPAKTFKSMIFIDWLNTLAYRTFNDDFSFKTLEQYILLCTKLMNKSEEEEDNSFLSDLTDVTIISLFFNETARYLIDQLEHNPSQIEKQLQHIIKDKNTRVNYAGLYDLEAKCVSASMQINLQRVTNLEIRKLAASLEVKKNIASDILALLHRMISLLPEESFKRHLAPLRAYIEENKSIDYDYLLVTSKPILIEILMNRKVLLNNLKTMEDEVKAFEVQKKNLEIDVLKVYHQKKMRLEQARLDIDKIPECAISYIAKCVSHLRNMEVLLDPNVKKCLIDPDYFPSLKQLLIKVMKTASGWIGEFAADVKQLDQKTAELKTLDAFLIKVFKDPYYGIAYAELLEHLYIRKPETVSSRSLEKAMEVYVPNCHQPNLAYLLSVVVIRKFFSKKLMLEITNTVEKTKLEELICKPMGDKQTDFVKNLFLPTHYPFAFFLQNVQHYHQGLGPVIGKYNSVLIFIDATTNKRDASQVLVNDPTLNTEFHKISEMFTMLIIKLKMGDAPTKAEAFPKLFDLFHSRTQGSNETTLYLLGITILNLIMRASTDEVDEAMESDKTIFHQFFKDCLSKEPAGTKFSKFSLMFMNLTNPTEDPLDVTLLFDNPTLVQVMSSKKILAMMGLLTICFDKMKYKSDSWKDWTDKVRTANFRCNVGINKYTENCLAVLEERIVSRLDNGSYQDYGGNLVKNLGIYKCPCGLVYMVDNCGYTVEVKNCQWCQKPIGGQGHTMLATQTQFKTLDDLCAYMRQKSGETDRDYTPHTMLNSSSSIYRILRVMELGYQSLVDNRKNMQSAKLFDDFVYNLYFRHLFDHMFLAVQKLFMPQDLWRDFDRKASADLNLNSRDSAFKTFGQKKIATAQDYYMVHIRNDTERISEKLKFNPSTKIFEWLRAVMSRMGEMIIKNSSEDTFTKLYIDRLIFNSAESVISEQNRISLERSTLTPEAKAALCLVQRDFTNIPHEIVDHTHLSLMKRIFKIEEYSEKKIFEIFNYTLEQRSRNLEVIRLVTKYRPLMLEFPRILASMVEICRYVYKEFSNKITLKEAKESLIVGSSLCKNKSKLIDLFTEFKSTSAQILKYTVDYPELFPFAVACQQNLRVEDVLGEMASDSSATLFHFIIPGAEETVYQSELILKSIIMTMINQIHNMVSATCQNEIEGISTEIKEATNTMSEAKDMEREIQKYNESIMGRINVKNSTYADYVYLPGDFDLEKLVLESSCFDAQSESENSYFIDFDRIKQKISRLLYKRPIQAEATDFHPFVYRDTRDMSATNREVRKFFSYASEEDDRLRVKKVIIKDAKILKEKGEVSAIHKDYLDLVSNTCRFLNAGLKYRSFGSPLFEVLHECTHEPETKEKIEHGLKQAIAQLKIEDELLVHDLNSFYKELNNISLDVFIDKNCSLPIDDKKGIRDLIDTIVAGSNKHLKVKGLVCAVKDFVYESMLGFYPKTENLGSKIIHMGDGGIDDFEEEVNKLTDEVLKEELTDYSDKLKIVLTEVSFDQWAVVQGLLK